MSKTLLTVALLPLLLLGCSRTVEQPEPEPSQEERPTPEESAAPAAAVTALPFTSGRSGVLGDPADTSTPALFNSREGRFSTAPVGLLSPAERRIVTFRSGETAVYGGDGALRWRRPTLFREPVVSGELLLLGTPSGVEARELSSGEVAWRLAFEGQIVALFARGRSVFVFTSREAVVIDPEAGTLSSRIGVTVSPDEVLLGEERFYLRYGGAVSAYSLDGTELWTFDAPGVRRITLGGVSTSGDAEVLLLEAGRGVVLLSSEGQSLWERELSAGFYRPVLAGERLFFAYPDGVLSTHDMKRGTLLVSRGVATAVPTRPVFWRGRLWVPEEGGGIISVTPAGEVEGRLRLQQESSTLLYGEGDYLGSVTVSGSYREIIPAEGGDLELAYKERRGGDAFRRPSVAPGEEALLVTLEEQPVTLSVMHRVEGVYRIELPLQQATEAIVDLVDQDDSVIASNLDKIELADSVRVRLEEGETYRLQLRPARDSLAGEPAAVGLTLLRRE